MRDKYYIRLLNDICCIRILIIIRLLKNPKFDTIIKQVITVDYLYISLRRQGQRKYFNDIGIKSNVRKPIVS